MNMRLHYDAERPPGQYGQFVIDNPSWTEIEQRIRALDQENLSDLSLEHESTGAELTIGGGRGQYVASLLREDGSNGTLVNPSVPKSGARVQLVVGDQPVDLPTHLIVELDQLLRVTRAFFDDANLESFEWE